MKKRLLSLLLVLAMVFSLMPAALAADKPSFQSFFESVPANAETEPGSPNSTNKWKVASLGGDYVLKSGGAGKSRASSTLQLTFTADAELTFEYKVSSEPKYDCFTITYDGAEKVKESGDLGWKTYTLSAESGKVLTLTYTKNSSGDKFGDCVYVRNFTAGKATVVTFHANGGVGADYTQNFYGQAQRLHEGGRRVRRLGDNTGRESRLHRRREAQPHGGDGSLRRLDAGVHRHLCL